MTNATPLQAALVIMSVSLEIFEVSRRARTSLSRYCRMMKYLREALSNESSTFGINTQTRICNHKQSSTAKTSIQKSLARYLKAIFLESTTSSPLPRTRDEGAL